MSSTARRSARSRERCWRRFPGSSSSSLPRPTGAAGRRGPITSSSPRWRAGSSNGRSPMSGKRARTRSSPRTRAASSRSLRDSGPRVRICRSCTSLKCWTMRIGTGAPKSVLEKKIVRGDPGSSAGFAGASFPDCSPRTAGPQPRDVLRLALRPGGRLRKGGGAPLRGEVRQYPVRQVQLTRRLVARTRLCRADECPKNGMKAFEAPDGLKVLVAHAGDRYFAYQAMCPHMEVPLEEGFYDGSVITCHQHLWQWDVRSGAPIGLAEAPLERYELQEQEGVLYVEPASALAQAPLFTGIGSATLEAIARLARRETFDGGTVLYGPGD